MVADFPAVRQLLHLTFIRHVGVVGKGAASAFTDTLTLDEFKVFPGPSWSCFVPQMPTGATRTLQVVPKGAGSTAPWIRLWSSQGVVFAPSPRGTKTGSFPRALEAQRPG